MIRREITAELMEAASEYPVVTVLGPRQSGKTTLVRMRFPKKEYRSLEEPDIRMAAQTDPRGFLASLPEGAVLDEIQRTPELLSYIQGIVDAGDARGRYILTGSHQPEVHQAVGQTLAGRTATLTLLPFSLVELRPYGPSTDPFDLAVTGLYPRVHEEKITPRRFRDIAGDPVEPGAVLYNGSTALTYKDAAVFNPLIHEGLESLAL